MKSFVFSGRTVAWFALAGVLTLSGCSEIRYALSGEDSVNYKSVVRTDPLSIPPDLTQASSDPRFRAPPTGTTTFSQYQQASQAAAKGPVSAEQSGVLPVRPDIRVERDGDLRWLSVAMPPEKVFPRVADFWVENGFTLDVTDPKAGLMITNWAENRARIPESWLRQLLSSVLEAAWDSGTRDKFRTRLERNGNRTEIYISHTHMVETRANDYNETVRWGPGKEDPGLNAAMIARLMVFLGDDVAGARQKMADAVEVPQQPKVSKPANVDGAIMIGESFDRAWRRVSVALDSGGFTVDDRDRSAGDFFVRYVDADTGVKREDPGLLSRLFGAKGPPPAQQFRLHLTNQGNQTEVTVFDANGKRDTSPTAQRILSVLADKL